MSSNARGWRNVSSKWVRGYYTLTRRLTSEEQAASTRRFYSKAEYDHAKTSASVECLRIQYLSDGLKVVDFLVKPRGS